MLYLILASLIAKAHKFMACFTPFKARNSSAALFPCTLQVGKRESHTPNSHLQPTDSSQDFRPAGTSEHFSKFHCCNWNITTACIVIARFALSSNGHSWHTILGYPPGHWASRFQTWSRSTLGLSLQGTLWASPRHFGCWCPVKQS